MASLHVVTQSCLSTQCSISLFQIESSHLVADRLNTIVALYPDIKDDVKVQSLTSQFNKSEYEGKDAVSWFL